MTPQERSPFILVDGSSYLFRAFHALPRLTTTKGVPTGAVYGVINMLRKLIKEYEPQYMAVIFDPPGKTFRNDLYTAYKANRTQMPDELRMQIQLLHETIEALGLPLMIIKGYEADDVIGTLATHAKSKGLKTLISTADKDLAQLVDKDVTLVNTMSNHYLNPETVKEKFGVRPDQIIDYFSLIGDAIDNVPGVPKVGAKTAEKWLNQYHTLDNLIKHAAEISGKVGDNLREHIKVLPLSRELLSIKLDVPLTVGIEQLQPKNPNKRKLIEIFKELEFKSWLNEIKGAEEEVPEHLTKANYQMILTKTAFQELLTKLNAAPGFAFDTETNHYLPMFADLVGISFALKNYEAFYIPLAHQYTGAPVQLNRDEVLSSLKLLLSDEKKILIGQNLKFDLQILKHYGVEVKTQLYDTLLEAYVLNNTSTRYDLETLAFKYLGATTLLFEDVAGKGAKQITFDQVSLDKATQYAGQESDLALQLHEKLWGMVQEQPICEKILKDIEWPLVPVLAQMEYNGVLIDAEKLKKQSKELEKRLLEIENETYAMAGQEFNLASPKQLQVVLFEKMQLPVLFKTPTGQPSTAESVLQELAVSFPLPKLILEYRSLSKLKSTYTDSLPEKINPKTGRVHTSYNQTVTSTGRLSSTDPNLQNIPIRHEEGRKIRQAFIPAKGHKILAADYSQIELRIMAHISQDPGLVHAFSQGIDIHQATSSEVFGVPLDQVTPNMRRSAKAINFGLMYGMSSFGLGQALGIERDESQKYIEIYFKRYPKVKAYMETARKQAFQNGCVETLFGRRLYVPEITATNLQRRRAAERAAINAPLQGTAADIIKLAMIDIHHWIQKEAPEIKMIMQVHDELVFEIPENQIEQASQKIRTLMENVNIQLSVPLIVDVGIGNNWDEAH